MDIAGSYTEMNAQTWDDWAAGGCDWSIPVSREEYRKATQGEWGVFLTPCRQVPKEWFGMLAGKRLLGLASGGGQQIPIFCALGACCTVFDYSLRQLQSEAGVARREGYAVEIVRGDMTKPLPFADESFDFIFHPVSNCYVQEVEPIWRECCRVLKRGGVLLAGFDNGLNFLFDDAHPLTVKNKLPFNPLQMPEEEQRRMIEHKEGIQFSHTLEEQIGGQLKAGLVLTDLYEDRDRPGCGVLRDYAPQYLATRAVKP